MIYIIEDWAGNMIVIPQRGILTTTWSSFESAEGALCEFLADDYDTDRQEYEIIEVKS